jgi:hypothetical protein
MIRFEQATISPSDPFALWPQYLEHLAIINHAIRRHNKRLWRDVHRQNAKARRLNKESREKCDSLRSLPERLYRKELRKYKALPWYKKLFYEFYTAPPYMPDPYPRLLPFELSMAFPITVNIKTPAIEDYLTWRAKQRDAHVPPAHK